MPHRELNSQGGSGWGEHPRLDHRGAQSDHHGSQSDQGALDSVSVFFSFWRWLPASLTPTASSDG